MRRPMCLGAVLGWVLAIPPCSSLFALTPNDVRVPVTPCPNTEFFISSCSGDPQLIEDAIKEFPLKAYLDLMATGARFVAVDLVDDFQEGLEASIPHSDPTAQTMGVYIQEFNLSVVRTNQLGFPLSRPVWTVAHEAGHAIDFHRGFPSRSTEFLAVVGPGLSDKDRSELYAASFAHYCVGTQSFLLGKPELAPHARKLRMYWARRYWEPRPPL